MKIPPDTETVSRHHENGSQTPSDLNISSIYEPIGRELLRVQENVRSSVQAEVPAVDEIVGHVFRAPGKLLRPALTLFAGRAVMADKSAPTPDVLIQLATAVELIHSASLVHDDILDGATVRRGIATLNSTYNTHITVLAGDVIFTQAFFLMTRHLKPDTIEPLTRVTAGMCHAEIMDEVHANGKMDFPTYLTIIRLKTAALMSVATESGARVSGAGEEVIDAMAEFGLNIGMAYQLIDDYVDGDVDHVEGFSPRYAVDAIEKARRALDRVQSSIYRSKLEEMLSLVSEMARARDMSTTFALGAMDT